MRGQSFFRGQSAFFLVVVVSLLRDKSFFVVSRLDRRGQSSWSVVFRDQSAFFVLVVVTSCVVGRDRPSRRRRHAQTTTLIYS